MAKTIAEKILSKHSGKSLKAGDFAVCKVDFCFAQDGTSSIIIDRIKELGVKKLINRNKFCMVIDHNSPSSNQGVSRIHQKMRNFAHRKNIDIFDIGCGVCHQIIPENGFIAPGDLVIGADSHTCTYGALNAFATGVGSTDLAIALVTGKNWFKVPETIKIIIEGRLPKGVFAKDVVLYIIGQLGSSGCTYKAIEYYGEFIDNLDMDGRFTISNMAVEMGAKVSIFTADRKAFSWLKKHGARREQNSQRADEYAVYTDVRRYDISKLKPQIAKPHAVDNVFPVKKIAGLRIDEAFIGTCTNGRLEDLKIAASILKGKKVNPDVKCIVAPVSREIYLKALKAGIIKILIEAGVAIISPGCGPCVGTHNGVPSDKEVVISTANRNFKGRMGNPNAFIYLASPATVAVSAIEGKVTNPRKYF